MNIMSQYMRCLDKIYKCIKKASQKSVVISSKIYIYIYHEVVMFIWWHSELYIPILLFYKENLDMKLGFFVKNIRF